MLAWVEGVKDKLINIGWKMQQQQQQQQQGQCLRIGAGGRMSIMGKYSTKVRGNREGLHLCHKNRKDTNSSSEMML